MSYTPLPEHLFHDSPVKKVIATVLIAIFLGIGAVYAMNRTTQVKKYTPAVVSTISPSKIPTALPTQVDTSLLCTDDAVCVQCPPTSDVEPDYPIRNNCVQGACINGQCNYESVLTTPSPTSITSQSVSNCPSGTVKVCQAGECECLPQ